MISSTFAGLWNANASSVSNKVMCPQAPSYGPLGIILTLGSVCFSCGCFSQSQDFLFPLLLCVGDLVTMWTVTAPGLPTLLPLAGNWALPSCQSNHARAWALGT